VHVDVDRVEVMQLVTRKDGWDGQVDVLGYGLT
jgi:hypothetical protein